MQTKKKGLLALSSLATIIIWIVATVVLLVTVSMIINMSTSATEEVICRNSVALRAKTVLGFDVGPIQEAYKKENFMPLLCKPQNKGELKGSREEVKKQVADLAAQCWWMYLEGSVPNLFDSNVRDENSCGICYYFQIPEGLDAGRISSNPDLVFFEELTKTRLSELTQLESDPELRRIIEESYAELEYNVLEHQGKEIIRPTTLISQQEMYNFLIAEQYDPKILYGGGNINYFGNIQEFDSLINLRMPREIRLRQINELPPTQLIDYTSLITEQTQQRITDFGGKLYRQENSILLVVVADEIQRNERRDARQVIERLNLNSQRDKHDAILITLDVKNGNIRVHLGGLLERHIKEHEVSAMLENHFNTITTPQELNTALTRLISDLEQRIIYSPGRVAENLRLVPEGSYYQYLSNDQTTAPIIETLTSDRTYAVIYKSLSDHQTWWDGIKQNQALMITGASVITIVTIVVIAKTAGTTTPAAVAGTKALWVAAIKGATVATTAKATGAFAGVYLTSYFILTDESFADTLSALTGTLGTGRGDNSIFIVPASLVSEICDEV